MSRPTEPIKPSHQALARLNTAMRWGGWAGRLAMRRWVEAVDVQGREHLEQGPLLVLMNHSSVFDPVLLIAHARRPIQLLVTEPVMRLGPPSRFAAWCGQIPKRKLDPDARALRVMKEWCQVGGVVGLFPEGQFPWDGRPLPLQPGLAQLVEYLGVPVVTVRLLNGDRLWPAWARHPRRTKLRMEIDPPRTLKGAEVESYVSKRLHVDQDRCPRWPVRGSRLAEGLARLLRYCPGCGADRALDDAGNQLRCVACRREWEVTPSNRLVGRQSTLRITEALRACESSARRAWESPQGFVSQGPVEVFDLSRREQLTLAQGSLRLEGGGLSLGAWHLDLGEVLAHTLDWGERIVLRTRRQRLALHLPHDSRALWSPALDSGCQPPKRETG